MFLKNLKYQTFAITVYQNMFLLRRLKLSKLKFKEVEPYSRALNESNDQLTIATLASPPLCRRVRERICNGLCDTRELENSEENSEIKVQIRLSVLFSFSN
jgi:hypothetical protein